MASDKRKWLKELVILSLFAAMIIAFKEAMNVLPNIHPVALLLLLAAERYGYKALMPTYAFVLVEGILHGFHIWFVGYLYVWALWVLLVIALRRFSHPVLWTILAGVFGLLFGTLTSIPFFFTGGLSLGITTIVAGLSFDIVHMFGNMAMVGLLYVPLRKALDIADRIHV